MISSRDRSGQAITEFLISAVTFLVVLLGTIQLALVLNAQSTVRLAAFNAARTAIVTGGDPQQLLEAARITLLPIFPRHGRAVTPQGVMENYLGAKATDQMTVWYGLNGKPITDVQIVRAKAGVTTFDDSSQASDTAITVRVVHQYELVIPLVNAIAARIIGLRHSTDLPRETLDSLAASAGREKAKRKVAQDSGYRIPLSADYTMHLQSDLEH